MDQATNMETRLAGPVPQEPALAQSGSNVLRRHIKENPRKAILARHRLWLDSIPHEYPMPYTPYKIGVYIRYFNQTRHENYLEKHIQQYMDDIALCPQWTLVDFYVDKGMTAPHMEYSKEWCRLLEDCFTGKVNLIVTQKVSNVSSDWKEMTFMARMLAAQEHEELPAAADAQVLVQGIADLVLVYPDHLELLDYKTDRRKAESDFLRAYRAQLNLYAIAIEKRFAPKKVTYKGIYSFALGKLIEA